MFSACIDYLSSLPISDAPKGQMQCICHIQDQTYVVCMARQLHQNSVVQSICVTCASLCQADLVASGPQRCSALAHAEPQIRRQMGGPKDHQKHHLSSASWGQCV